jgi:hypothetical protein
MSAKKVLDKIVKNSDVTHDNWRKEMEEEAQHRAIRHAPVEHQTELMREFMGITSQEAARPGRPSKQK